MYGATGLQCLLALALVSAWLHLRRERKRTKSLQAKAVDHLLIASAALTMLDGVVTTLDAELPSSEPPENQSHPTPTVG